MSSDDANGKIMNPKDIYDYDTLLRGYQIHYNVIMFTFTGVELGWSPHQYLSCSLQALSYSPPSLSQSWSIKYGKSHRQLQHTQLIFQYFAYIYLVILEYEKYKMKIQQQKQRNNHIYWMVVQTVDDWYTSYPMCNTHKAHPYYGNK